MRFTAVVIRFQCSAIGGKTNPCRTSSFVLLSYLSHPVPSDLVSCITTPRESIHYSTRPPKLIRITFFTQSSLCHARIYKQQATMSSAGNRGMISNNAGSPNWNFSKRNSSDAGEKDASTAQRRRVSVVLSAAKELSTSLHSLNICFTEK